MSEQPKALRLADEPFWTDDDCASAAAELRRLHALCEEMGEALERIAKYEWKKGCGFCHPEGCESPSIAKKALAKWKESK